MPPNREQYPSCSPERIHPRGTRYGRQVRERLVLVVLVLVASAGTAQAWGRGTNLVRRYRPGQRMVYRTSIETEAKIRSNPEGLKAFLPPLPTRLSTRQQNTVTVRSVSPEGVAEVENRFDEFELESNLPDLVSEENRDSTRAAQEDLGKLVRGQTLTVRYDRSGKLLGFEGTEAVLGDLDPPLRQAAQQMLRLFLEQMGGHSLYPGYRVKKGEEWKQKLDASPAEGFPFQVEGESTMRFIGKARYRGVKAAVIDFNFTNILRPSMPSLREAGPLAQLASRGMALDIKIDGQGQGRMLVALDDGRVLQNHATIRQTLSARLNTAAGVHLPVAGPLTVDVDSQTRLELEGEGQPGH